jgi:hypothetical protein
MPGDEKQGARPRLLLLIFRGKCRNTHRAPMRAVDPEIENMCVVSA